MLRKMNIHTALLIGFAFVFRLFFLNGSALMAQSTKVPNVPKCNFPLAISTVKHFDVNHGLLKVQNISDEYCEEEADGDEKLKSIFYTQLFYSSQIVSVRKIENKSTPFNPSVCIIIPHRYLALQVFRI